MTFELFQLFQRKFEDLRKIGLQILNSIDFMVKSRKSDQNLQFSLKYFGSVGP